MAASVILSQFLSVTRKQKDRTRVNVASPMSVVQYNKYMEGVDQNDQLRGYYHLRLKCRKYIFWLMFEVAVANSLILCTNHTDIGIKDNKTFRVMLAKSLIGNYCSRKRSRQCPIAHHRRGSALHTFLCVDQTETTAATTARSTGRRDMKPSGIAGTVSTFSATMGQKRTASTCTTCTMCHQLLARLKFALYVC